MNALLVGGGAREHALAWKIRQSPRVQKLYIAPGNAGTLQHGINLSIQINDLQGITQAIKDYNIGLVIVGQELPLLLGLREYITNQLNGILIIGPGKKGALLEGSKDFSKNFMLRNGIPTAKSKSFSADELSEAKRYLSTHTLPLVLKADGLAAGKGVIICHSLEKANEAITDMLVKNRFGEAGNRVLIEEFLTGIEISIFILTDGDNYVLLPEAKDYKRIGENDTGENTGGMGAVSPVPFADASFMQTVDKTIIQPTLFGLKSESIPFCGFIYFGLINVNGKPYVLEYNVRLGDPEAEAILPRIDSDLVDIFIACAKGELKKTRIKISDDYATTVVLASEGYPNEYKTGHTITGLEIGTDSLLFHAATKVKDQNIITNGGRVMAITGKGSSLKEARIKVYETISAISWKGMYFRNDIGLDLQNTE